MGRRLTAEQQIERAKLKRLIHQIRRTNKYLAWKLKILKRDVRSYPKIPKGVQVHHRIEISKLLAEYNIKTVKQALRCDELWTMELGISIKRGEHFIITKLMRYKYITEGFRTLLFSWFDNTHMDRLDVNQKRGKK